MFSIKYITIASGALTLVPIILYAIKNRQIKAELKELINKYKTDHYQYKFIFITNDSFENCRGHIFRSMSCGRTCSQEYLQVVLKTIRSAKSTILICMYHLTLQSVLEELINCTKRNVEIRCITDRVMATSAASKYRLLLKNGVEVKIPTNKTGLMHHKFIVIDDVLPTAKIIVGSLNMTMQAITNNWDYFVITNNKFMISRYAEEFHYLWKEFSSL